MSDNMVTRVADAIDMSPEFSGTREGAVALARAAIEAMREMTDEITDAYFSGVESSDGGMLSPDAYHLKASGWEAIFDAALASPPLQDIE